MNREKDLAKNTLILSMSMFVPKIISLVTLPIVTAFVTKTEMGTFDLLGTIMSFLLSFLTLQVQSAAFRFLIDVRNDETKRKEIISTIILFVSAVIIVATIGISVCIPGVRGVTRVFIALLFITNALLLTFQQVVRGLSQNALYSAGVVIQTLVNLVLILLLILGLRKGLNGLLIASTASQFAELIFLFVKGKLHQSIRPSLFSKHCLKEMIGYSWPMIPSALSLWVMSLSDRLIITFFLGLEANAIYSVANRIPQLFESVQATFIQAWQENASISSKDDDADLYYSKMFDSIFCIVVGLISLLIAVTPLIFTIVIQGDYSDSYNQIPILFMAMLFSCMSAFLGGIYVAHKKTKSVGTTTMCAAVINIVVDLVFVKQIGIYAGSISTLVSYLVLVVFRMVDIKSFVSISYQLKKILISISIFIVMCILAFQQNLIINIFNGIIGFSFALVCNQNTIKVFIRAFRKRFNKGK